MDGVWVSDTIRERRRGEGGGRDLGGRGGNEIKTGEEKREL